MRRIGKIRPPNLSSLWIVPIVYVLAAVLMLVSLPRTGAVAIVSVVGLVIGAVVGWQRGKMMHVHVDLETHALNQKASPPAMFFLIAVSVVPAGARSVLNETGGVSPAMLTDPRIAFAFGMFALTLLEMYLCARRLLEQVRART